MFLQYRRSFLSTWSANCLTQTHQSPISLCLLRLLMRHRGLPCPSPPSLDQLLPFKCVNVLQSFSVNLSQKTFPPLLHIQTPLSESDQGNLVGNFLA